MEAAVERWAWIGVDPDRRRNLSEIDVLIDDLPNSLLGQAYSDSIVIDGDAAGHGWSIDPTATGLPGTSGVDLFSVVVHELGHLLAFNHDVMGSTLGVGVRDLNFLDDLPIDSLPRTQIRHPGDANRDGQFGHTDLVAVRQHGRYLTGQRADWTGGDWNGDGLFDQLDIVAALQTGNYIGAMEYVTEVDAVFAEL